MPSLSAVLLIFSFRFSLLFLHLGIQTAAAFLSCSGVRGLPRTSDVAENVGSIIRGVQPRGMILN